MQWVGNQEAFFLPISSQAYGQVETVNKIIKYTLKRKLDVSKGAWVDLPQILWAIHTMNRTTTSQTPFFITYGAVAMSLIK